MTPAHSPTLLPFPIGRAAAALAAVLLAGAALPGQQPAADTALPAVRCTPPTITAGEATTCSFRLPEPATVTATVSGPDGLPVATLLDGQPRPAGTVSVTWDGRDGSGTPVPDEAYAIGIDLDGSAAASGWTGTSQRQQPADRLVVTLDVTREEEGVRLSYTLPQPARVRILAGIQNGGPLLRTILADEPRPAGPHQLLWDGLDDTGHIRVTEQPEWGTTIVATPLPPGVVIVQGNGGDYLAYSRQQRGNEQTARRTALAASQALVRGKGMVRFTVAGRPAGSRSAQGTAASRRPLAGPAPIPASGIFDLTVLIDEAYQEVFDQTRFETVIFIDGKRFDEEENAFSPYTYHLDTRRLANGPHLVTINQVGLTGEIGSYSFTLDVQN